MDQHNRAVGRLLSSEDTGFNRLYFISGLSHRNQSSRHYLIASRHLFFPPSALAKDVVNDLCVSSLESAGPALVFLSARIFRETEK